tara:strand:+ start:1209 stop:1394 length:186 start_codon:yes stop_codon:yes gene_type:complete
MENVNPLVPVKYLMTKFDWIRLWREEAVKKDCKKRLKQKGFTPTQHRNVWLHIKISTDQDA